MIRVQHHAVWFDVLPAAVRVVTYDQVADVGAVNPQLVGPT